jgi:beta-galactosidase
MKKILGTLLVICISVFSLQDCYADDGKGKFEIGKNTFLLNGKPFIVKAAEIHYTRIPAEYWEHRIRMCKALGMNTICIYVFWNIHEQTPGNFDFTGQNDVAQFCRLAQKHGMYIIVRPGPYVCAEWEMGGLPWWLLKKKDIKVRTNDPYFLERTNIYLNEIGKQLKDLQITKGGNIIMVQVENEYGSYNTDKEYVSNIRDMVKGSGFTEVPLFQCDWSSNFKNNGLDDLLWTINFGTGANIKEQFKNLKEARPDIPLMCSEYWSGWFDHWGRAHETRPAAAMIAGMKDMLDEKISFSLYMAHGGTTFGHWGGANSPAYSAMCSSMIMMHRLASPDGLPKNIMLCATCCQTIWMREKS